MGLLLFAVKYGVLVAGLFALLSLVSGELYELLQKFRRESRFAQVIFATIFCMVILYGGAKPKGEVTSDDNTTEQSRLTKTSQKDTNGNEDINNSNPSKNNVNVTRSLPQWYLNLGYSTIDSDGDGMPDVWEKWTRTQVNVDDALLDYDSDGVDNITEFIYQCDPWCVDTDGDGIVDREEIDGALDGIVELNPIVYADFYVEEVDSNGNGISDIWENSGYSIFCDENQNGFDDEYELYLESVGQDCFDVALSITSTRTCLLEWRDVSFLIEPCTNKLVKLRISGEDQSEDVSLRAFPQGGLNSGLWKARISVSYLPVNEQVVSNNCIKYDNSKWFVFDNMNVDFVGYVKNRTRNATDGCLTIHGEREIVSVFIDELACCIEHGPAPDGLIEASSNAMPLSLSLNGNSVTITNTPARLLEYYSTEDLFPYNRLELVVKPCNVTNNYGLKSKFVYYFSKLCRPGITNIVGAGWSSTHNHTNATDHLPEIKQEIQSFGANCPVATNTIAKIGFSHNKVNTRNLVRILTTDSRENDTDHCIGLIQNKKSITTNLFEFVEVDDVFIRDKLYFKIKRESYFSSTERCDGNYTFRNNTDDLCPDVYYVRLLHKNINRDLDTMWIVVNSNRALKLFEKWFDKSTNNWFNTLPEVYDRIDMINVGNNLIINKNYYYDSWNTPEVCNTFLHHNAKFEMRSNNYGSHGHQACYDENGFLIRETIAAGTADFYKPLSFYLDFSFPLIIEFHYRYDVVPFLRALSLDGNPGIYNYRYSPTDLSSPCIYQGKRVNDYMNRRPVIPNGEKTLQ